MRIRNFLVKKSYIDMEYVYGTLHRADGAKIEAFLK